MSKEPKLERAQWFNKKNQFIANDIFRRICRRQLPVYLLDIYKRNWLSNHMLRLRSSRWFRACMLLPVMILLGEACILVNLSAETPMVWHETLAVVFSAIALANTVLIVGIIVVWKDLREFSLCVKHIIVLADSSTRHKLAPENFPKTTGKFTAFVNDTLVDMARWVIYYQARGELDEEAEIRLKLRQLYDTAKSFGVKLEDYKDYYKKAEKLHKSGFHASNSGSFLTKS